MHELGIAGEILSVVLSEAATRDAKKVSAVTIRVGVLRGIVPENLRFLFDSLARGTAAENAGLTIEEETVEIECAACGPTKSHGMAWECPTCGSPLISVSGGDSLRILSVRLEV